MKPGMLKRSLVIGAFCLSSLGVVGTAFGQATITPSTDGPATPGAMNPAETQPGTIQPGTSFVDPLTLEERNTGSFLRSPTVSYGGTDRTGASNRSMDQAPGRMGTGGTSDMATGAPSAEIATGELPNVMQGTVVNSIRQRIVESPSLSGAANGIRVTEADGTLTLTGVVQTEAQRNEAEQIARDAANNLRVTNQIQVQTAAQ